MSGAPQEPDCAEDLLDHAPCGFLRFGDDGVILKANTTLCEMVGRGSGEIVGQHISTLLSRGGGVFYQTHFFPLLRLHGKVEEIYLSVRHKEGEILPVLINAVRHPSGDSEINDCVIIQMKQRSRFEEEILVQKKEAERANQLKAETLEALTESEKNLRSLTGELEALMREVPVAIFVGQGADCETISGNPAAHRLLGKSQVPAGVAPVEDLLAAFHRDGRALAKDELPLQRAAATGEAIPDEEWDLVLPGGVERRILGNAIPLFDEAGAPTGSLGTFIDITERKQVETALHESATLFSTLVGHAPIGMYVVDSHMRLQQVNELAAPVFDSVSPLLGRELAEVMEILWGPEVGGACTDIFRNTLDTGERYVSPSFEEQRHDLGVEQAFEWETHRLTLPDGQFGVVCYFQEITERVMADRALRESEQRMHLATEATAVGIWEWHLPTGKIKWDPQMFRIYGFEPTEDGVVPHSLWSEAVLPEDLPAQEVNLQATLRRGGKTHREFRIRRRSDGELRHLEAVEVARHDEEGQPVWLVGTNLDVTARTLAREELENASRAKDDFLAALSHELRTPLTPVLMTAATLEKDASLPPEIRQELGMMRRNIELEALLIDDLLDITKISRGKLTIAREVADIHDLLRHTIEILRSDYQKKNIALELQLGASRHHAEVDPTRVQQVFWNLLKNAVKFTPEGGKITVTTRDDGDGRLVVAVQDSGIGIAAEAIKAVFKPFEQGEVAGKHRYGGLGLGLAISHAIVKAHGGTIAATSEGSGHGATFTTTFDAADAPVAAPGKATADPIAGGSLRMLIVEDHESTRRVLAKLLGDAGHEVTTAADLKGAREAYTAKVFDLVISDLGLPDGSGLDLMREIQAQRPVPAIALSGYGMEEDARRIKEAGFAAHFVKPIQIEPLHQLIAQVTQG